MVEVPDFGSKYAQALQAEWPELKPWEHIYHFTEPVLKELLKGAGFITVKIYHHGGKGILLAERSGASKPLNTVRRLLFEARHILYTFKPVMSVIRLIYWELMRNHNMLTLVAQKKD